MRARQGGAGQLDRRTVGAQAVAVEHLRARVHRQAGQFAPERAEQVRRAALLAARIREMAGKQQAFPGAGERLVDGFLLHEHALGAGRGQRDAEAVERETVAIAQNARALRRFGQHAVVHAEQMTCL